MLKLQKAQSSRAQQATAQPSSTNDIFRKVKIPTYLCLCIYLAMPCTEIAACEGRVRTRDSILEEEGWGTGKATPTWKPAKQKDQANVIILY